jgi:uncharacterized protein YjaZ
MNKELEKIHNEIKNSMQDKIEEKMSIEKDIHDLRRVESVLRDYMDGKIVKVCEKFDAYNSFYLNDENIKCVLSHGHQYKFYITENNELMKKIIPFLGKKVKCKKDSFEYMVEAIEKNWIKLICLETNMIWMKVSHEEFLRDFELNDYSRVI